MKLYFAPHGEMLTALYKNSRHMSTKVISILTQSRQFRMPEKDLKIWIDDDSGISAQPAPGFEGVDPSSRIFYHVHRDLQTLLMGTPLNVMTAKFVDIFTKQLADKTDITDQWTELPDLLAFCRTEMLTAAIISLCGEHILELTPTFVADFWQFDDALPWIFKEMPRWLIPRRYAARDKMLVNIKKYHLFGADPKNFDWEDEAAVNADWEPVYGHRIMRARRQMCKNAGMSVEGNSATDLGMIWA
jgi:hypothetical protein